MKNIYYTLLLIAATVMVACERDTSLSNEGVNQQISFMASITSRATETAFENGDEISVTAYSTDGATYAENVKHSYLNSEFKSDTPIRYSSGNSELSFIALYPYVELSGDKKVNFSVLTDQSSGSNYTMSDLLISTTDKTSSDTPILSFSHLLTKVVVNISKSNVDMTNVVATINAMPDVEYDIATLTPTTTGAQSPITMASDGVNSYKAIFAPQTIVSNETIGTISIDGTLYEFGYNIDVEMQAGKVYTINAEINGDKIIFDNPIIEDWNNVVMDDDDANREVLIFSELQATSEYQGLTTQAQFTKAISQISEGGILQLEEGATYTIDSDLSITKSILLRGVGVTPAPNMATATSLSEVAGAGDINTTIKLSSSAASLIVKADDVTFKHLRVEGGGIGSGSGNVIEINGIIDNFHLENVHIWGGGYHLSPRNHMSPGLECRYVTFEDFHNRGFFINRIYETYDGANYTKLDKCTFYRCYFKVNDPNTSDTRAISLDAGNTENPDIMDFDGMDITECYFHDIGIASSKCRNFNITDCEFYVKDLFDFPIHLEEYTREVVLSGCLFDCDNSEEIMIGVFDDSVVENCTVKGNCYGFIQGRYAEGMVVRNNDLSQMTNINPATTPRAISFWDAVGSRDITITDNNMSGSVYIRVTSEDQDTIVFSNNGTATNDLSITSGYSFPLDDGAVCRIKNKNTGLYLMAKSANGYIEETSTLTDESLWKVKQVWPNRYNVYNDKYETYLYIEKDTEGYSSNDTALAANILLQTKTFDGENERVPIWDFTVQSSGTYPTCSILGPGGGNDGCVGVLSGSIICQKYASDDTNRRSKNNVSDDWSLWEFITY